MGRLHHASRNPELVKGIGKYSRSVMYRRSGKAQKKKSGVAWKAVAKKAPEQTQPKTKPFRKETRVIEPKGPHYYPEYDIPKPLKSRKHNHRPARLRPSLTPGTVLILLAGRFRARRVVFLKQLPSGLLLVTGPFQVNAVPLRRVNQAYVIATSTKIDISGIQVPKKIDDAYFTKPKKEKKKQTEEDFFATETKKKVIDKSRIEDQKALDTQLLAVLSKEPRLIDYLHSRFTLSRNDRPHAMKF